MERTLPLRRAEKARRGVRPAVLAAVCLAAGLQAAPSLCALPIGATALLIVLGAASRRPWGLAVSWVALGLAVGWVRVEEPRRNAVGIDARRPVVARVRLAGRFRPAEGGFGAPAWIETVRQGTAVALARQRVWLFVGGEEEPPPGVVLWARGYLRPGEPPGNDLSGRTAMARLTVKSRRLVSSREVGAGRNPTRRRLRRLLDRGRGAVGEGVGPRLAAALVLGEPWRLDEPLRRSLRDWGLAHLTAASGLHVGMVALAVGALTAWGRGRRWLAPTAAVIGYCALVGGRPALLRAAVMLALLWCARGALRRPDGLSALAAAGGGLLLMEPTLISDLGFRLSILATFGILWLGGRFRGAWRGPRWLIAPLSLSVGAQLATLPLTVTTFWTVPVLAPVLNLFFVPWTALCLAAGGVWLSLAAAGLPVDAAWLTPLAVPFQLLAARAAPAWATPTWTPSLPVASLASGMLAWILCRRPRWSMTVPIVVLWLCLTPPRARHPEIWMLDVGQGDSFLLRSERRAVLVDGGGWRNGDFGRRVLLPALARLGVRRLDLVILSHPDTDHCGGLADAVGRVRIDRLWVGAGAGRAGCGRRLLESTGAAIERLRGGESIEVAGWAIEVAPVAAEGSSNRRSVVVRAAAAGFAVLLTGDLDREGERALMRSRFPLRADVLKVAHHGSRSSSTSSFLDAVSPRYALISAGRGNNYGHPAAEVVEKLLERGVTVLRSDLDGRVGLRLLDDRRISLEVERSRWLERVEERNLLVFRRGS